MPETETQKSPQDFLLSHYITLALLILIFDKSGFSNTIKQHCKTGLKVLGIIYANQAYNIGTKALSNKEFDAFFKLFPNTYYNNRELIPVDLIIKNIKLCITTDDIVYMSGEYQ
ncbi:hypothetical protein Q4Q39_12345 [Flavivirga amylovorans]|uniref:Uncharacterized protein n=1 Tax=Flavivirga amylovorans TaxID=870486 RepID=A0ABT8X2L7_9FLAO|nr:hypothetical protein [Flavivirga amylovorans]MDO5988196.1 hypothetical protein [Flavivirga amylovorans]